MLPMFSAEYMKNYRATSLHFWRLMGRNIGYLINPSRSQSSPWACPDYLRRPSGYSQMCDKYEADFLATPPLQMPFTYKASHPFDALLAERRAILAGERDAIAAVGKKDAAWWDERRLG